MRKSRFLLAIFGVTLLTSCTILPVDQSIRGRSDFFPTCKYKNECNCKTISTTDALDSSSIKVLVWNVYKGGTPIWKEAFEDLSLDKDLILIQEACLDGSMEESFERTKMKDWHIGISWAHWVSNIPNGVVTISDANPFSVCLLRATEPIIATPKSSLLTYFHLTDSDKDLLVANVHSIAFSLTWSFESQMMVLKEHIRGHDGPMIVAGDFNTWSSGRLECLKEIMSSKELGLTPVEFDPDHRTRRWWLFSEYGYPMDHMFYRGLGVRHCSVKGFDDENDAPSDHNPMIVEFFLEDKD